MKIDSFLPKKKYCIRAACGCNVGKIRANNEDNLFFNGVILPLNNRGLEEPLSFYSALLSPICFGVFDGMGGESNGEEASYLSANEMKLQVEHSWQQPEKLLMTICQRANERICESARLHKSGAMGSTAALLIFTGEQVYAANLGDSKILLYRQKKLFQLSTDHTDQAFLQSQGITGRKPRLTQHLGIEPAEMIIEPAMRCQKILPGDRFILCSDGLSDMLSWNEIMTILDNNPEPIDAVRSLMDDALQHGGRDNITVIDCVVTMKA